MTPQEIAEASPLVRESWAYLRETAGSIQNAELRRQVLDILDNPAPTLAKNLDQEAASRALSKAGLRVAAAQTPLLPPTADPQRARNQLPQRTGRRLASHRLPGGLVTHVAMNVRSAGAAPRLSETFGFTPDKDVALAARSCCTTCTSPGFPVAQGRGPAA